MESQEFNLDTNHNSYVPYVESPTTKVSHDPGLMSYLKCLISHTTHQHHLQTSLLSNSCSYSAENPLVCLLAVSHYLTDPLPRPDSPWLPHLSSYQENKLAIA